MFGPRFRSGAGVLGALLVTAAMAGAQSAPADTAGGVPAAVEDSVRARVAALWQVDASRVVLDFGSVPEGWAPLPDARVTLAGSGSGGYWIVRVTPSEGAEAGVRVRAGVETDVMVASRPLQRGVEVRATDMSTATEIQWGDPTPAATTVQEGWQTQRLVREGEPLRTPAVQPPMMVRSGETVAVVWKKGKIGVRVPGKAAGTAAMGGEVYVRTDTGRRLRGVVVAPGVVDVTKGGIEG